MGILGRSRMIASVNELTGREDCVEAVIVQERPRWAALASLGCLVVIFAMTVALSLPLLLVQGLLILAVIFPLTLSGKHWIVARSGDSVLLAKSSKWWARATEITEQQVAPVEVGTGRGILQKRVLLFDRHLILAWPFLARFRSITGAS